ncbi:alpha/beta hydrolase [Microbacterium testaceum]|uniref:alpha/beta hydrolase n=1 Tax=Microbacterium testaceum TaxID=2033 RepID=UPI0022E4343A|nr:alpha/beta hydrolase [Microbacterium testaceum]
MSTDPAVLVPGSPASIDTAIRGWKARADHAEENRLALTKLAVPDGWQGSAPVAFSDHVRKVASTWMPLQQSLTVASGALQEYSSTLTWARDQAGVAIDTWLQAKRAEEQAPLLPTTQAAASEVEALREKAWSILRHAQTRVAEAGDRAAGIIRTAAAQPELTPAAWQRVGETVSTPEQAAAFLASLSASDIDDVLAARPDLVALLQQLDPAAINRWWTSLSVAAQNALVISSPGFVGNLEGVPYTTRDKANRRALTQRLRDAEHEMADAGDPLPDSPPPTAEQIREHQERLDAAREELDALRGVREGLETKQGRSPRFLVSLTDDHPPLAAVSIGDLDTADNVTVAVPGMTSEAAAMRGWATSSDELQLRQAEADPSRQHAVVAWIGYRAPASPEDGDLSVLSNTMARDGAVKLNSAIEGLSAVRPNASLNVLAHSYGSTTAAIALAQSDVRIDNFVVIGSAGFPTEIAHAADLNADAVFAAEANMALPFTGLPGDELAWIGRTSDHPVDPTHPLFGAQTFDVQGGEGLGKAVTRHVTSTPEGTGYLDPGTQSLASIALATTGTRTIAPPVYPWFF